MRLLVWHLQSIVTCGLTIATASCIHTPEVQPRPTTWGQVLVDPRLDNFHRVSGQLYRSALPDEDGYAAARENDIRTIINLRPSRSAREPSGAISHYHNIPVRSGAPTYDQAREFFRVVDDPANQPVLLHCYHGADRTGAFVALYRINRQGWSTEEAIREMTGGGYRFHTMWKSLADWVRNAPAF